MTRVSQEKRLEINLPLKLKKRKQSERNHTHVTVTRSHGDPEGAKEEVNTNQHGPQKKNSSYRLDDKDEGSCDETDWRLKRRLATKALHPVSGRQQTSAKRELLIRRLLMLRNSVRKAVI